MSVELRPLGIKIEPNETFLSLDTNQNVIVLSTSSGFGYIPLTNSKDRGFYCSDKPIKDVKFSASGIYAAAQFNDTDIEILNLHDGRRVILQTRYKSTKGTTILGCYFLSSKLDTLLVITNISLELYQINSAQIEIQCKLAKDVKHKIHTFVFSAKASIVLTYGGAGNTIQPYKFTPTYIERLAKFAVDSPGPLDLNGLYLSVLSGKNICVFTDRNQMAIYQLNSEVVYRTLHIKLLMSGANSIHFVDNIIIMHFNQYKVSMVYDPNMLKDPENFPISAIPMVLATSLTHSSSSGSLQQLSMHHPQQQQQQQQQLYLDTWRFISPNYIYDTANGHWYEVTLNFEKISNFFQVDTHKIIPFLQLRSSMGAKLALFEHIRYIIEYRSESLETLGKIFDSLNNDLVQNAGKNHTQMLYQHLNKSGSSENLKQSLGSSSTLLKSSASSTDLAAQSTTTTNLGGSLRQDSLAQKPRFVPPPSSTTRPSNGVSLSSSRGAANALRTSNDTSSDNISQGLPHVQHAASVNNNNALSQSQSQTQSQSQSQSAATQTKIATRGLTTIIVNSEDLHEHVFYPIYESLIHKIQDIKECKTRTPQEQKKALRQAEMDSKFLIAVVTEYIRSLNFKYCGRSDKLYTLLISLFIDNQMFSQLHRFLQYNVVEDSESIAIKLLAIGESYPPALQLSLDMFKRLNQQDVIISTLLEKKQVLLALRYMRSTMKKYNAHVNVFLLYASQQNDDTLFYTVYKFFEQSNQLDNCDKYVALFNEKFKPTSASAGHPHHQRSSSASTSSTPGSVVGSTTPPITSK
ncbi:hypothetical protein SAMD00019534_008620 [Acytostelium subglobosum LB1]|uniref:hypothetical protein n=1 Tax=Acytostelium subglobosum LB1 TaxID=1410327 RepID=UPI0006450AF4|nr:hypothetical protein SAMD00019534_008620 [Acytostelium subglobosum LB1]GAM17687.1 hypothetical protein SAMD00019534_008620 [Acytostelium subglobosum LB1]|eukprot:XP_012758283.1 hypothetical protein SAMD00019534_008620 [Acytostelium subglobosum LB1]